MTYESDSPPLPYMLIRRSDLSRDLELDRTNELARGARKIVVSQLWRDIEEPIVNTLWRPVPSGRLTPVFESADFEMAIFTDRAKQDRHLHRKGTEIYTLLDGTMTIEVAGEKLRLSAGDSVIVRPGAVHLIETAEAPFLAQVVILGGGGMADKFICEQL